MNVAPGYLLLLCLLCILIFTLKRNYVIIPFIVAMCFLPADISIKFGNLNFTALRILALLGALRLLFSPISNNKPKFNLIDHLFIFYHVFGSIIYIIASDNKTGAFIFKMGQSVDGIVIYLVFRHIILSIDDLRIIINTFCICVLLLLPFIVSEYFFTENLFSVVGRSGIITRSGEVRAAGVFNHPILFGSFAVAILPILRANYLTNKKKIVGLVSIIGAFFFIFASSSSGPLAVLLCVLFFLSFFSYRKHCTLLYYFIVFIAVFIHFARDLPLWHFMFVRLTIKGSSTGFHRYLLVDAAIKEFQNWWLIGYGDQGAQWHEKYWPWTHAHFTDITNHYLLEGVRGGSITMLAFIYLCYKSTTTCVHLSIVEENKERQWIWWGFTVMMLAHSISFLSVAYFGQITMLLFLTFAISAFGYNDIKRSM